MLLQRASVAAIANIYKSSLFAWANWPGYKMTSKHDDAIYALRTRQNTLALISRLPVEILAFVFYFIMIEDRVGTHYHSNFWYSSLGWSWITVTHVCRHWREVALQDACLWSNIRSGRRSHLQELMLTRSKALPISYYGSMLKAYEELQICPHVSRIRLLSLQELDPNRAEYIFGSLMTRSPLLESLSLRYLGRPYQSFILPLELLGQTSRLRHIALYDVWIPWSAPILYGLTSLHIALSPDQPPVRPLPTHYSSSVASPFEQLLCALERVPSLETLHLCNAVPPRSGSELAHDRIVDLPCLRSLELTGATEDCLRFLKSIKVPSSCDTFLTECIAEGDRHLLHTFDIELRSGCNAGITKQSCRVRIPFTLGSPGSLDALCHAFPDTVRAFSVCDYGPRWLPETWIHLFKRCSAMEDIHLTRQYALSFCLALVEDKTTEGQLLPSLRSVEFTSVDFGDDYVDRRQGRVLYYVLAEWIALSGTAKQPPIMLRIQGCDIWKQWVAKLRQACQVEWDGCEGHYGRN